MAGLVAIGLLAGGLLSLLNGDQVDPPATSSIGARASASPTAANNAPQSRVAVDEPFQSEGWSIRVLDASGSPLARVQVSSFAGDELGLTNDEGHANVEADVSGVAATLAPFVPGVASRPLGSLVRPVELVLAVGSEVHGTVVDQDDRPLAGVLVEIAIGVNRFGHHDDSAATKATAHTRYLHAHGTDGQRSYTARCCTDARGAFRLRGLAAEQACLQASLKGYVHASQSVPGAILDGESINLKDGTPDQPLQIVMRRIYVGVVAVHGPTNLEPAAFRNLVGIGMSEPSGLEPFGFSQRSADVTRFRQRLESTFPVHFAGIYVAQPSSSIRSQMLTRWTLSSPCGSEQLPVAMTPLDLFDESQVVQAECNDVPRLHEVHVKSAIPINLAMAQAAKSFASVRTRDDVQVFEVPAGLYWCSPTLPMLVDLKQRSEVFEVSGEIATTFRPTKFEGLGSIRVQVVDHLDRPTEDYSIWLRTQHGEAIFTGEGGWNQYFPCEPGQCEIVVRDRAMRRVGSQTVECKPGTPTQVRIVGG